MLLKLADAIEARADELGRLESRNAGKPVGAAIEEIPVVVDNLRFFAGARAGDGGQGGQRVHGRPHLDDPARAGRRGRLDRAVELPDHDGRLEDRPGPRGRQRGHPQAVGADAADRPGPGRDRVRDPAARRAQRHHRDGRHDRRPARRPPEGRDDLGHRRHRYRQAHRQGRGRSGQAAPSRARWQGAGHRLRRRRPRSRHREPSSCSATGMRARTARRACRVITGPKIYDKFVAELADAGQDRSSGATRPKATTSRWAR